MNLQEHEYSCPYCGEMITALLDPSAGSEEYIEDCQVCCRPIVINVLIDSEGHMAMTAKAENE